MYLFMSKNEIQGYNGEILKRYIGKKLVKTISNPTDEDLREFGYKPLDDTAEIPEYDETMQYVSVKYTDTADKIIKEYEIKDIPTPQPDEISDVSEETDNAED